MDQVPEDPTPLASNRPLSDADRSALEPGSIENAQGALSLEEPVRRLSRRKLLGLAGGVMGAGLVAGGQGRLIYILNEQHARYLYRGHTAEISALAWSPTSQRVASGAEKLQVWDALSGAHAQTFPALEGVQAVAWSPNGKYLAVGSGYGTASVWEVATGNKLLIYGGHVPDRPPRDLAGPHAALAQPLARRTPQQVIIGVSGLGWSPDGTRLLSTGPDFTAQVWEAFTGRTLLTFGPPRNDTVHASVWSPDGRQIATLSFEEVRLWDAPSGGLLSTSRGIAGDVGSLAWSPNGRYLAGTGDLVVYVWEAATVRQVLTYQGHTDFVHVAAWSPDSRRLVSAGRDMTVRIWEAPTGQTEYVYRGHLGFWGQYFSAQAPQAAQASGNPVAAPRGQGDPLAGSANLLRPQDGPPSPGIWALAWAPDGRYIASGGLDADMSATVQVWQPGE